ncbi:MAG: toxin [Deltaproteobacteria bacterium]|jgi:mRNA-degrading endonuclease RelE of RelBE toxin-antitoxin system|nr:toxin [Deltaproteobacteria bacterium]
MKYNYYPTPRFLKKLHKISRRDPSGYTRILDVVRRLLETPADSDGKMVGLYHGRLKKYVGRRDYRIIYHWCLECRKARQHLENPCEACGLIENNSVVFFDLYHKNELNQLRCHSAT